MLVPLTRETLEQVIPLIATGPQYAHYWGKTSDVIRRLLISIIALTAFWLLGKLLGDQWQAIDLILDIIAGLYWLWGPIYLAGVRNLSYRRLPYCGFWRGRVLDVYITEELIGKEETVNKEGELVIVENREKRLNLEVGDRDGFRANIQAPLRRIHKGITPGSVAELLLLSRQPDLGKIDKITDVYLPRNDLWIGEYPYLRRDVFKQIGLEFSRRNNAPPRRNSSLDRGRYDN